MPSVAKKYEELSSKSNVKYISVELNQSSSVDASKSWSKQLHGIHWKRKIWRSSEERCYNSWSTIIKIPHLPELAASVLSVEKDILSRIFPLQTFTRLNTLRNLKTGP